MGLRIALLAHSTNPRGGVVHALELGGALARRGHDVVVHAPDTAGTGFFRHTGCETVAVPAGGDVVPDDTFGLVNARVADYLRHFEPPARRRFDVFHAQDGLSGNALATLKERGLIDGFIRTVHHLDSFADGRLDALQRRSVLAADGWLAVSRDTADHLHEALGVAATVVGNGVDAARFTSRPAPLDLMLRRRLGLGPGPVFLAVGGVEARKNTIGTLQAFADVHRLRPEAQLVIAGGASLLDHGTYQARFATARAESGLPDHALRMVGRVADDEMPALYRNADALVFPSLQEGYGLTVLEAMACGVPVVVPAAPPFTEYLGDSDALWCTPEQPGAIADAMMLALLPMLRKALIPRGAAVAARHSWDAVAAAHAPVYAAVGALHHA